MASVFFLADRQTDRQTDIQLYYRSCQPLKTTKKPTIIFFSKLGENEQIIEKSAKSGKSAKSANKTQKVLKNHFAPTAQL